MIIVDPVALGDVAVTRASPKWAFDRTGTLVQVPANTLAVTYDPADLSAAPYALVEPEATNYVRNNTMAGAIIGTSTLPRNWGPATNVPGVQRQVVGAGQDDGIDYVDVRFYGTVNGVAIPEYTIMFDTGSVTPAAAGQKWASSYFATAISGTVDVVENFEHYILGYRSTGGLSEAINALHGVPTGALRQNRLQMTGTLTSPETAFVTNRFDLNLKGGTYDVDVVVRLGMPQLEREAASSPIKTVATFASRSTSGTYWDSTGALQTAAANVERMTYSPADLSAAPYKLWEGQATNYIRNNTMQGAVAGTPGTLPTNWNNAIAAGITRTIVGTGIEDGIDYIDVQFSGNTIAQAIVEFQQVTAIAVAGGETWAGSVFVRLAAGSLANVPLMRTRMREGLAAGTFVTDALVPIQPTSARLASQRFTQLRTTGATSERLTFQVVIEIGGEVDFTLRIGLPQLERSVVSSPIKTSGAAVTRTADVVTSAAVTRAADVIGAGAGLVYSNVPITEPNYDVAATYGKGTVVHDPATHNLFESLIATNKGHALTDTGAWTPRGATNRWAMLDQYNNTQTVAADEILIVVSPEAISQGLYLGNVYADEVRVSVVDQVEGVVYRETAVLLESNSESSFFNWLFKRIKRRDYFFTLSMPPYANALVTISLRKVAGTAKCGMCAIGPTDEFGPTLLGLSTEGKDYSSTTFNFDGTSNTIVRPYAKKMSCDVFLDNDQIDYLQARLFELRQKPIVWVGGPYGSTAVFGRYGSFKNVIQYQTYSSMNLTLEGAV